MTLTFGSLFAGIGGFDLGFKRAGMICRWQVEIDEWKQLILQKQFPDVPKFRDVRKCGKQNLEPVDVVCGGSPCTDLSVCSFGSHEGLDGEESGLIREFARIADELLPEWVVIENVSAIKTDAAQVQRLFGRWSFEYADLSADFFGAYTRRTRTFFVGHLGGRSQRRILDFTYLPRAAYQTGGHDDTLPMCLPWAGGLSLERLGSCVIENPKTYTFRMRKGDGISRQLDKRRWDAVGNAVAVPLIEYIGRNIVEAEA